MADYMFQVRMEGTSGVPEDVFENVLFFDVTAPDTVKGRCDDLVALYGAQNWLGGFNYVEVRAYPLTGGQPLESSRAATAGVYVNSMPHEVAVCLSYTATDDLAAALPRRRGRIFMGPLAATNTFAAPRPPASLRTSVLDFGEALAQIGTAGNTTWKLFSRTDNVTYKIEKIYVDDAWDTQRRRGVDPTLRDSRDVQ